MSESLRIRTLELRLSRLTEQVALLSSLVDPEDVEAARRLRVITPTPEEFEELAMDANPPEELLEGE